MTKKFLCTYTIHINKDVYVYHYIFAHIQQNSTTFEKKVDFFFILGVKSLIRQISCWKYGTFDAPTLRAHYSPTITNVIKIFTGHKYNVKSFRRKNFTGAVLIHELGAKNAQNCKIHIKNTNF